MARGFLVTFIPCQVVSHNGSRIFGYIRSLSGRPGLPSVMSYNSVVADTPSEIASLFNQYFHSVYNSNSSSVSQPPPTLPEVSLRSIDISVHDLFKALCSLNCGKAMGGDGIPPIILKGTAAAILEPLHHLFARCTQKSSLPAEWRDHYITPIPKSGDRSIVCNYRPISLLSCISKLFEWLVFDQVSTFLMETSLSNSQFGFIQNRSAAKQLLLHTKSIISALDSHHNVFLDIRKAFDSVPHDQLLLKLWNLGLTGSVWQLIKSYLTGRRQCVRVEGQLPGWLPVCSGVPQGSILGPLLFLTYINDLPSFVSFSSTLLFADDTKLSRLVSSPSHCSELQADITALQQWISSSELSFNASKSFLLRFCTMLSPISVDYDLNGSSIPFVSHGRDLGIMFSSHLSWSEHYKLICSSAY